uniref:Ribonuclease kappa n=1 Tax=Panagrolaimus sp. PS1159 TaxID=55785 RepID=A0AC35FVL5_9BILA
MGVIGCLGGPVCTGLMLMVSIWGVIFLSIMGGLFQNESVGLLADLPEEEHKNISWNERVVNIKGLYKDNARNCWIAAGAYVIVLIYSATRMFFITR